MARVFVTDPEFLERRVGKVETVPEVAVGNGIYIVHRYDPQHRDINHRRDRSGSPRNSHC